MKLLASECVSVPKYVVNGWTDRYTIARENKCLLKSRTLFSSSSKPAGPISLFCSAIIKIYLKYDKPRYFVFFPWSENLCIYIYLPTLLLFYYYILVKILMNLKKNCFNKYFTNWNTLQLINNKNLANF